jgi:tRNA G18 (ribose-2'-O)-methylase SpoU
MRLQTEHRDLGIFVAEGEKVVRRLLESSFPVVSLLVQQRWLEEFKSLLENHRDRIDVYVAEKKELEKLTGYSLFQGALAIGKIPIRMTLDTVLSTSKPPYLIAAIEGTTNAINIGTVVRNCVAFGVQALIVGETSCSPYLRRAVRNSMGAIFHLPVIETENLVETLKALKNHKVHCIAAHPHTEEKIISKIDLTQSCCLLFGNEGYGLSAEILKICDHRVVVPMSPHVDSLNVASANAVFLYEVARQRNFKNSNINKV